MKIKSKNLLFVGEARSDRAKELGITWKSGGLAAKQLFDALLAYGIDPDEVEFTNWFEYGGKTKTKNWVGTVIGMGQKVCSALEDENIKHVQMVHPAARGRIRKKKRYIAHVALVLDTIKDK